MCAGLEWIFITSKLLSVDGGVCGRLCGDVYYVLAAIPEGTFCHGGGCIEGMKNLNHGEERNIGT